MDVIAASTAYLQDELIALRPFQPDEAPRVFEAIQESRADLVPWLPDIKGVASVTDVSAYIDSQPGAWARGETYSFAILDPRTGIFLGGCGLIQINHRHRFANLYYWVKTGQTGIGIATRATRLLARFGCEILALQRIEIVVPAGNVASIRVAEKAGARREGVLRNRITLHDIVHDAVMFSLIPGDFGR